VEVVDVVAVLIVAAAAIGGFVAWRRQMLVRELRASSPPGALVRPEDPLEVVQAKNRTWSMLQESVRIFHEVLARDAALPILPQETRRSIEALLAAYYQREKE
jgi:hypothetical protein